MHKFSNQTATVEIYRNKLLQSFINELLNPELLPVHFQQQFFDSRINQFLQNLDRFGWT